MPRSGTTPDATNVAAAGAVMDSDITPSEGILRKTGAGTYTAHKSNLDAAVAPVVTDDTAAGYSVGSIWIDTTADAAYVCVDSSAGAAVWLQYMTAAQVSKLAGIEALADVTDATNVAAAGAVMDSDITPSEGILRKTGAGAYTAHKSNLAAAVAPAVTDDTAAGYSVGSIWIDTTADNAYVCVDSSAGAAVWLQYMTVAQVSKLAGIEALADVTDATNVAAAGAVMDSDIAPGEGILRKTGAGAYTAHKSNLAAAVAPAVTDDTAAGYSVGSIWIDTTADNAYVCVDSSAGAAVWLQYMTVAQVSKLAGIEALADVTDATNVAAAGAVMDSDITPGEGILRKTGAGTYTAHKSNLAAAVAPAVTDDTAAGYSVGSVWIDTTGDAAYVCVDSSAGAAVWLQFMTAAQVSKLAGIEALADVTDATNVAAAGAVMDSDITPGEGILRKTGAGTYTAHKSNLAAAVAPTVNADGVAGYSVGSIWIDTTGDAAYVCVDSSTGAAVWLQYMTAAQVTKLAGIEALADVTDATNVAAAGVERHRTIWHDEDTIVAGGARRVLQTTSQSFNMYCDQNPAADADSFSQEIFLASGTYTLKILGETGSGNGKIDWYLNAVKVFDASDWYSAGATWNVVKSQVSISVAGGSYTFKGTVNGKNASSTGYAYAITKSWFERTGA